MTPDYASIDSVLDAVATPLLVSAENRLVFANHAAQTLTGYSTSQLQTLSLAFLLPAYEPGAALPTPSASPLATADGRVLQVQIHTSPTEYHGIQASLLTLHVESLLGWVQQSTGTEINNIPVASDIQHLLQQIMRMVPLDIYICDLNQRTNVFHNRSTNMGQHMKSSSQNFFAEIIHPADQERLVEHSQRLKNARDGEILESEYRMLEAGGQYRWYYFRDIVFARNPDGTPRQFLGSMLDITARKEAEASLRHNEEQLRLITDNMGDVVSHITPEGRIAYTSPSCYAIFGYTPDELIGQTGFEGVHPDDLATTIAKFQHAIQTHTSEISEYRYRHKDGHYVWVESAGGAVYDAKGQITSLIATTRDITPRKQAEELLRQSEEQYRLLADSSTDVIGLHELDGTCIYASPSIERQTGWSVEEVVGRTAQQHVHPQDVERVFQQLTESFQTGREATVEYRFQCKDGSYIWVESHNRLTFRPDGTPHRVVATTRNITARKQAETALKENEERLRLITDNMSDVIVQISPQGLIRYVSPSSRDVLGYEPHELINEPTFIRIHPDDQPLVALKFQSAYVDRKPETMEVRYRHKNGDYLWIELSGMVVVTDDGRVRGLVASLRNIEERIRADTALKENAELLLLITDNIHDMVSLTDSDLIFRYTSPSFYNILGYSRDELIGKSIFALVHEDDVGTMTHQTHITVEQHQSDTIECRFQHKDGYFIWIEINSTILIDADGNITGVVFTARDISERRLMQRTQVEHERLQNALQKQQELNALKNRMMTRLSHELRTPLAVISTSSDLLEHYAHRMTEDQRRERLQQIRHQIKHFVGMLDNMSLVVKGTTYSGEFAPTPYNLEALCHILIEEIKNALHAKHTVELNLQGSLKAVNSDEKLMRLILTHLLANALKFSPAQMPISLDLNVSDSVILLTITDQGIGIPPEDQEHIFDPFFRASNIGEVPGLGIGLSIVKDAVLSSHGTIEVISEPGQGTQVKVSIPLGTEGAKMPGDLSMAINSV